MERTDLALYKVTHTTVYGYSEPAPVCQNVVHLTPRSGPYQRCLSHKLTIKPHPATISRRLDYFGNHVHQFSLVEGHSRLQVRAVSRVEVRATRTSPPGNSPPWDSLRAELAGDYSPRALDARQFQHESPSVPLFAALEEYARESFPAGRPVAEGALDLIGRVHRDFVYDGGATTIHTPLEEVMRDRRGVCQDFAHVAIGSLRSLGLPARYVSGYLRTRPAPGRERLVGADASHAWLAVYCGSAGWLDLDPTNNAMPRVEHITLAWGRDFGDVSPITGMFVGGGQHTLEVSVDVEPSEV